ncbi:MAG: hypothetical protein ABI580_01760 [Burkholderiaceae bacterium]
MSITQRLQDLLRIASLLSLFATSSVSAQSLVCSVTRHWKVSSVTQSSNDEEVSLAIETTDARGTIQQMTVSIPLGSTRFVTQHGRAGWNSAVHVQESERPQTAKVSTLAWCDGRMRGYDETVLPIQMPLDRT